MKLHVHVSQVRRSLIGPLLIAGIGKHVVRIRLDDDVEALRAAVLREHPTGVFKRGSAATQDAARWLRAYLDGGADPAFDAVLPEKGFSTRVWRRLRRIPRGQVRTYGGVAKALRRPGGARAVGQACGRNPLPLLYPCHRVVAADLSLGGFAGGLDMKRQLLELEGARFRE